MSAERTPRTWGANVWPTAQQLADWLAVCTDAERLEHATIALRDAQAADRCFVQHADRSRPGLGTAGVTGAQPDEPVTQAGRPVAGGAL